jgi:hypothetical protein
VEIWFWNQGDLGIACFKEYFNYTIKLAPGPGAYCIPSEFGDVDFPEPVDLTKV